jgi:oligopeptide transport system substrate-binding protein
LELAGRTGEAIERLLEAGDRARGLYAHQEAVGAYERALALLKEQGDDDRAARTLMKLGLTYHTAYEFEQSRKAYEEGFALWQRSARSRAPASLPPAPHAYRGPWAEPLTLDPTRCGDIHSHAVIDQLLSALVSLTPEMDIVPDVAQSWDVLEEGRKYVFHLRGDVRWTDGVPVTAGDFACAMRRIVDPRTASPVPGMLYDIKGARPFHLGETTDADSVGIHCVGDHTLVIELEEPVGYFLHLLSHAYPVPLHLVETRGDGWIDDAVIVTNGPFRLESWSRGEALLLSRNPDYHGSFTGNLAHIQLLLNRTDEEELAMYEADRLDVIPLRESLSPDEVDRARRLHADEYLTIPLLNTLFVTFDVRRPPFHDVRVRRAFAMATDRGTLCDVNLGGLGFPAVGGFIPPGMVGHSSGTALPYDPDRATELLAEAGYPSGRGFPDVVAMASPAHARRCRFLREQWRQALRVDVRWQLADHKEVLTRIERSRAHLVMYAWIADYPDPDNMLRIGLSGISAGWTHTGYEKLVKEARRLTDHSARIERYLEAERILVEEVPLLPLEYDRTHLLVKPWIRRHPVSAMGFWYWKDVVMEPH